MNNHCSVRTQIAQFERWALILATVLCTALPATGQIWNEVGDAGDLVGTHQVPTGSGPLTTIVGDLFVSAGPYGDVDMYCIHIDDPMTFSATLAVGANISSVEPLWLFDAGAGGVTSQEGFYIPAPTQITGTFLPPGPADYYLAISPHDVFALNAANAEIWSFAPRTLETPPNGTGAAGPLTQWAAFGSGFPVAYEIQLTGASYCLVPEPAPLSLFGLGGLLVLASRRRAHSFPGSAWERTGLQAPPAVFAHPAAGASTRMAMHERQ